MRKFSQKPETIEEYSTALRHRLAGALPPEKIEEVVAEAQAHLEDSAANLRYQADVYERQAVAHFVPVRKMARGVSRAWAPVFLRHSGTKPLQNISLIVSSLGILWILAVMIAHTKLPSWLLFPDISPVFFLLFPATVFVLALFACRPQVRRFAYAGVVTTTICFLLGGFLCREKGMFPSRLDAPEHYKDSLAAYDFRNEEIRLLRQGLQWARFSAEQSPAKQLAMLPPSLRQNDGSILIPESDHQYLSSMSAFHDPYIVPQPNRRQEQGRRNTIATIRYTQPSTTQDLAVALSTWQKEGSYWLDTQERYQAWNKQERTNILKLIVQSEGDFHLEPAHILGQVGAGMVGILLLADLLGGYAGMALLRLQRRRQQLRRIGLGA